MSWLVSTVIAAAIVCAPEPAPNAAPPRVRLEVDTSSLPESSATNSFTRWLVQDQTGTILDGGVEVSPDASTGIRIVVTRYGEHDVHYKAALGLVDGNGEIVGEERVITCELCTDGQLITKVSPEVARLAARVLYAPVPVVEEPEVVGEPTQEPEEPKAEPEPVAEPTPPAQPPSKPFGALGAAGIASAVVGIGVTSAGTGLALTRDRWRLVDGTLEVRSTRPTGLALVGIGTVLAITGAVLVAVDVTRRQKARRLSVLPDLSVSSVFVSVNVRF